MYIPDKEKQFLGGGCGKTLTRLLLVCSDVLLAQP